MAEAGDERECIAKSQRGESEAFEVLVARYQRMIHELTYRMTGSMSDAEDLAQEVFIRAYRQLGSFRGEAKFSSWLYRIGVNTCLNWRKSAARREQLHEDWTNQPPVSGEDKELCIRVQEALMKLNPNQRAAIIATVYDGMNHAEAARALGCAEATISWRVFMARKKLRQWLVS